MAKTTKEVEEVAVPVAEPVDDFAIDPALLKLIASLDAKVSGGGEGKRSNIVFLPEGTHYIKMVVPQDREIETYFEPYTNIYQGKPSTNYLINGVIVKSTKEGLEDREKVRHIRLPGTAVRQVNAQLILPIFADTGPVLTVKIYKESGNTKYIISPFDKRFDSSKAEFPEMTIDEAARDAEEFAKKKNSENSIDALPFATPSKDDGVKW